MSYQRFRTEEGTRACREGGAYSLENVSGGRGKSMVRVRLSNWDEVRRLCSERSAGSVFVTATAKGLVPGDRVTAFVEMPEGLRLSLEGEVCSRRPGPTERWTVELVGLTRELAARLTAMSQPVDAGLDVPARGSREWSLPDGDSGNHVLRSQIDGLAGKMKG